MDQQNNLRNQVPQQGSISGRPEGTTGPQEPLNGQQISAMSKRWSDQLAMVMQATDARKYAVEKAIMCLSEKPISPDQFIELATKIHDFITLPATEVKVTLS